MANLLKGDLSRRQFIAGTMISLGAMPFAASASAGDDQALTVQQLIDLILKDIPTTISNTVDTVKIGDVSQKITGVVTSMFPTIEVIQKAIAANANFLIVHEPSFYSHTDETKWLERDDVFQFKKSLLENHQIAVWRFHDYIHRHDPDGVLEGVVEALKWKKYQNTDNRSVFSLPRLQSVGELVKHMKSSLNIQTLRIVGNLSEQAQKILLLPGAWGGRNQMNMIMDTNPDLIVVGEVAEWETAEYIRDSRAMGLKRSLVVLGHAQSEEPGLAWLARWLNVKVPSIKVHHIPSQTPFVFA